MRAIKLGGSVLTNKGQADAPMYDQATGDRLAREIAQANGADIVVHGGGSFGHPVALSHRVGDLELSAAEVPRVVSEIRAAMEPLTQHVLSSLRGQGLRAAGIPASVVARRVDGAVEFDAAPFGAFAERGLTAVTSGDVVLDDELGASILSGDDVLAMLAAKLDLRRVVFVADVDQVSLQGAPVARMDANDALRAASELGRNGSSDATGGIAGKLEAMAHIARTGAQVVLVNGKREGRVAQALDGKPVTSTIVEVDG